MLDRFYIYKLFVGLDVNGLIVGVVLLFRVNVVLERLVL